MAREARFCYNVPDTRTQKGRPMYERLREVTLKNGEAAELGVLRGPDDSDLARQVRTLLAHKGRIWQWQIEQSLARQFSRAESRFYLACRDGRPLANVMTVEADGVGIFGHVYTRPEERRKGLADAIIRQLSEDFRRRGGRALYLGTGYDSPAYRIYARHGFQSIEPRSGFMAWFARSQEAFEQETFAPAAVRREAFCFEHWPTLPALAIMRHPARVRIVGMGVVNPVITEGGALPVLMAMQHEAEHSEENGARAQVAVSEKSGVPVAVACVMPERYFWQQVDLLDAFCAPGFEAELLPLCERLELSRERTALSYADEFWPARQELLRALGFARAATLPRHFRALGESRDVELWHKP